MHTALPEKLPLRRVLMCANCEEKQGNDVMSEEGASACGKGHMGQGDASFLLKLSSEHMSLLPPNHGDTHIKRTVLTICKRTVQ